MKKATHPLLSGTVIESTTGKPLQGVTITAIDGKGNPVQGVQQAATNSKGTFALRASTASAHSALVEKKATLAVRVAAADGTPIHTTKNVRLKEKAPALTIRIPSTHQPLRETRVCVSVHAPGGALYDKTITIRLKSKSTTIALTRDKHTMLYEAIVEPGVYRMDVSAGSLSSPSRTVVVPTQGKATSVYLGEKDWPYYRLGEHIVPFQPHDDILAIAFPCKAPEEKQSRELVQKLKRALPIEPLQFHEDSALPFRTANGAVWLFTITQKLDAKRYAQVLDKIRAVLGNDVRAGVPVDLQHGQVKVLDNQFVVRFRDHLKPNDIERLVKAANARVLRSFIQAGNARLIEFAKGWYREHLEVVEKWHEEGLLVYGEPDIMAEITDDVFPADPPNDPTYPAQANLTLQGANTAWQFLNGIAPALTLGSPNVYVSTLDRGVDTDHPDIGGNLTDGTPQLAQCYDFSGMRACTVPGYAPDTSHGMGVYGIISALTNNANDMAGIAPNVHHIGMERPNLTSVNYPDVLLWAAGFTTGNPTAGWPAEPISPAADIISCSHGSDGLALSGIMDDTFQYLATYGRGGRGALMIYSAGNSSTLITGFRTWAAHPRTMAISNSNQPDGMGVERLNGTSNFGPEIDICAQGNGAPSLNDVGGEQIFGGTSAAAPTVAAAAALMLSVEPTLTWINLRDILRATAVMIDPTNVDPVGQWVGGFSQWYGFGRLNINAAVQGANTFDPASVNLVVRDNLADTGTIVPTAGVFWRSPDLWVRSSDPAADPALAYGDAPPNQSAISGADNWVRVRVKNVGTAASSNFYVRVYLTHFAGSQFQYPTNYIPSINTGDPIPSPLVQGTYLIGEQFVASLGANTDQTFSFLWPAALVPPETVGGTSWHPCLLAEVSPHTGPAPSGNLVTDNTNLCQRNITISYSDDSEDHEMTGVIGHRNDDSRIKRIIVHRGNLPKEATLWVRLPDTAVEEAAVRLLHKPNHDTPAPTHGCCCGTPAVPHHPQKNNSPGVVVDSRNRGQRIFRLAEGSRLTLDVPMVSGRLTPVVVGASIPKKYAKGSYEIVLVEQDTVSKALGGFAFVIEPK